MADGGHKWLFFRAGGVEQVAIRSAADLLHLPELDPKLWAALAIPTRGLELDSRTLELLDTDHDGRVRIPEILAAIKLLEAGLADPGAVLAAKGELAVAAIKDARLAAAARRFLDELGRKDKHAIAVDDIADHAAAVAKLPVNGDGVLPPESAAAPETQRVIRDIIDSLGGVADKSGGVGVDQAIVDRFFAEAQGYVDWHEKGEADRELWPLGDATSAAVAATREVRAKIDDYFIRCKLAVFDPRVQAALGVAEADLAALAAQPLAATAPEVARLPLARIEGARPLPLRDGMNPAWSGPMATFVTVAMTPLVGTRAQLGEPDWAAVQAKLAAPEAWAAAQPATAVDELGIARLREILASGARAELSALIARDAAQEALNQEIVEVEKLLRYQRDLREILENFVNFSRFYRQEGAVFQAGTLYIDGRSCNLCIEVADAAKHAALAAMADSYLAYLDVARAGAEKKSIVCAFTGGDSDNLFVGRNGVFIDRKGRDWDATIVKVVANPISVREAFWSPYKKIARLIEEQVQKRAHSAEVQTVPTEPKKVDVGTVAAIGVAIGGIGALVVGVMSVFFGMGPWMPIGLVAFLLLISGPSMVLALLKLRRRNLGPLLDANGWAVNGRARINVPFGGALTRMAKLPRLAERTLDDPFADKRRPVWLYIVLAAIVLLVVIWLSGKLDPLLPRAARWSEINPPGKAAAPAPAPATAPPAAGSTK